MPQSDNLNFSSKGISCNDYHSSNFLMAKGDENLQTIRVMHPQSPTFIKPALENFIMLHELQNI